MFLTEGRDCSPETRGERGISHEDGEDLGEAFRDRFSSSAKILGSHSRMCARKVSFANRAYLTCSTLSGLVRMQSAPIFRAAISASWVLTRATVNASRLLLSSRAVLSRKLASKPSSQSATTASSLRLVRRWTAAKISGQCSTSNSSSRKAWISTRDVSSSEENKRDSGGIKTSVAVGMGPNKLRSATIRVLLVHAPGPRAACPPGHDPLSIKKAMQPVLSPILLAGRPD